MIILIPAYKPDDNLLNFIDSIKVNSNYMIVLVNDGSPSEFDNIFKVAINKDVDFVDYKINKGKGGALKAGLEFIKNNYPDSSVITADADGQHTIDAIKKVANQMELSPESLVLGSRGFTGNVPFKSIAGNTITRIIFSLFTGKKIFDTQTGLRGIPNYLIMQMINLKGNRYEYEMNMLLYAADVGIDIIEVEIETIYNNDNKGSHFNALRDPILIYALIVSSSLPAIISFILEISAFFTGIFILKEIHFDWFSLIFVLLFSYSFSILIEVLLSLFKSGKDVYKRYKKRFYFFKLIMFLVSYGIIYLLFFNMDYNIIISKIISLIVIFILQLISLKFISFKK